MTNLIYLAGLLVLVVVVGILRRADPVLRHTTLVDWEVWRSTCLPGPGPWYAWLLPEHEVENHEGQVYGYKRHRGTRFALRSWGLRRIRSTKEYYALFDRSE